MATVDASTGLVTAVAVGTATITVTTSDGSKQASCEVTVAPVAVTGVSLEPATLNLVYEDTANPDRHRGASQMPPTRGLPGHP